MKHQVLCIYDSKARVFFKPYYVTTLEVGKRAFMGALQDAATEVSKFPSDFTLFHLGAFDDELGVFESLVPSVNLGNGASYLLFSRNQEVVNAS